MEEGNIPAEDRSPERERFPDRPGLTRDADVWAAFAHWRDERRRFVLATVTAARGFTPRKPGAHMLIAEGGACVGTIGGGAIEAEVLAAAARLLQTGGSLELKRHLRSEEHTSELQSHVNLVCRLLLEKKKKKKGAATV